MDNSTVQKIFLRLNASKKRLLADAELIAPVEKYSTYRGRILDELGEFERELKALLQSGMVR